MILQLYSDCLDCQRVGIQQKDRLISGLCLDFLEIYNGNARHAQLLPQKPLAQCKAPADQRIVFHRTGDVHGKTDHGLAIGAQQRLLPGSPPLPGFQHFG